MNNLSRFFPWLVVGAATAYFAVLLVPPRQPASEMQLYEFGKIPIVDNGRIKPLDSLARNTLFVISNRQTAQDEKQKTQPAIRWLLDVLTTTLPDKDSAAEFRTVTVAQPGVQKLLGLEPREGNLYAITELVPKLPQLLERARTARDLPPAQMGAEDREILQLADILMQFAQLIRWESPRQVPALPVQAMLRPLPPRGVAEGYRVFRIDNDQVLNTLGLEQRPGSYRYSVRELAGKFADIEREARRAGGLDPKNQDLFDKKILDLHHHLGMYLQLLQWKKPDRAVAVPTAEGGWVALRPALEEAMFSGTMDPNLGSFGNILRAYSLGDAELFNQEVAAYQQRLNEQLPKETQMARFEVFFNHVAPFYHCAILYVLVFLLACVGWLGYTEPLNRAAFWLGVTTLIFHTVALIARMYLMDRWFVFVTNLYSSAIFIGWGCVLLGLTLELIYRNGIGNVVAGVTGALSLVIGHHLAADRDGDTLEMMQAVLDTNFWLATHVTSVTIGYTATFVAGALGIIYILRGLLTRSLNRDAVKSLSQMIYGIVCFATFFSFIGTVLGGIWADQSWGRFWGWDPKENGALIIVLWNALILHARWGGMIKQRGLAVLAVAGNIVTAWSWFGVNQLSVGLHSYGHKEGTSYWLWVFDSGMLWIIAMGLIPLRYWRSFSAQQATPPKPDRKPRDRRPVAASPS